MRRSTAAAAAAVASRAAPGPGKPTAGVEHDFGGKVVVFSMRREGKADDPSGGAFEKATVRRLGDRSFLVGECRPPAGGADHPYKGVPVWVPLADVTQVLEFDTWEASDRAAVEDKRMRAQVEAGKDKDK